MPAAASRTSMLALSAVLASVIAGEARADDDGEPFDGGTVVAQSAAGVGGMIVGGALGALAGAGIASLDESSEHPLSGLAEALLGGAIGLAIGDVVAVKLVGDARGAEGSWVGASLGFVSGAVPVIALGIVAGEYDIPVPPVLGIGLAMTVLVGGSVVGYQLTNDGPPPTTERRFMVALPIATF